MQAANRLQQALLSKQAVTFGAWQTLPGHNLTRTIARCGFEWICVDAEHGNIDGMATLQANVEGQRTLVDPKTCSDAAMHEAVATISSCGVSPIVRIAANEGWMVKSPALHALSVQGTL